jgi:4-carboxymuconolactone decarboxylase
MNPENNRMEDDNRKATLAFVAEMISPQMADALAEFENSNEFGAYLGKLGLDFVFGQLWTRPGLDRRSRSLVTLGILITLRATEELNVHIAAALRNGVTRQELEEVIYHSSAYAGFPAASSARSLAAKILVIAKAE